MKDMKDMKDQYGARLLGLGVAAVFAGMLALNALAFAAAH